MSENSPIINSINPHNHHTTTGTNTNSANSNNTHSTNTSNHNNNNPCSPSSNDLPFSDSYISSLQCSLLSTHRLLNLLSPTATAQNARQIVFNHLARLIQTASSNAQPFMFGSVPLRTFLPDGDIDVGALVPPRLVPSFFTKLRSLLESENNEYVKFCQRKEKELATNSTTDSIPGLQPFPIRSVNFINAAEVKIVKCLVGNLLVDVSSNTTAALATVCYLEEIDQYIDKQLNTKHLFKHSILLCKAWTCYEARILASHHALLSTYALETLVLFILNKFHSICNTPLLVLYQFLCFYSTFDFEKYCISIRGPIPISKYTNDNTNTGASKHSRDSTISDPSSPNSPQTGISSSPSTPHSVSSTPILSPLSSLPLDESSFKPLLSEEYLIHLDTKYSIRKAYTKVFGLKYLNICDPLDDSNNLGRSVNYSNYLRIRHAFQRGADDLMAIIKESKEIAREITAEWKHNSQLKSQQNKQNSFNNGVNGHNNIGSSNNYYDSDNEEKEDFEPQRFINNFQLEQIITTYPAIQHNYISKQHVKQVRRLWLRLDEFFKNTWKRHKNGIRPDVGLLNQLPHSELNNPPPPIIPLNPEAIIDSSIIPISQSVPTSRPHSLPISKPNSRPNSTPNSPALSSNLNSSSSSSNIPSISLDSTASTSISPSPIPNLTAVRRTSVGSNRSSQTSPAKPNGVNNINQNLNNTGIQIVSTAATRQDSLAFPISPFSPTHADSMDVDLNELSARFDVLRSQWIKYQNQMLQDQIQHKPSHPQPTNSTHSGAHFSHTAPIPAIPVTVQSSLPQNTINGAVPVPVVVHVPLSSEFPFTAVPIVDPLNNPTSLAGFPIQPLITHLQPAPVQHNHGKNYPNRHNNQNQHNTQHQRANLNKNSKKYQNINQQPVQLVTQPTIQPTAPITEGEPIAPPVITEIGPNIASPGSLNDNKGNYTANNTNNNNNHNNPNYQVRQPKPPRNYQPNQQFQTNNPNISLNNVNPHGLQIANNNPQQQYPQPQQAIHQNQPRPQKHNKHNNTHNNNNNTHNPQHQFVNPSIPVVLPSEGSTPSQLISPSLIPIDPLVSVIHPNGNTIIPPPIGPLLPVVPVMNPHPNPNNSKGTKRQQHQNQNSNQRKQNIPQNTNTNNNTNNNIANRPHNNNPVQVASPPVLGRQLHRNDNNNNNNALPYVPMNSMPQMGLIPGALPNPPGTLLIPGPIPLPNTGYIPNANAAGLNEPLLHHTPQYFHPMPHPSNNNHHNNNNRGVNYLPHHHINLSTNNRNSFNGSNNVNNGGLLPTPYQVPQAQVFHPPVLHPPDSFSSNSLPPNSSNGNSFSNSNGNNASSNSPEVSSNSDILSQSSHSEPNSGHSSVNAEPPANTVTKVDIITHIKDIINGKVTTLPNSTISVQDVPQTVAKQQQQQQQQSAIAHHNQQSQVHSHIGIPLSNNSSLPASNIGSTIGQFVGPYQQQLIKLQQAAANAKQEENKALNNMNNDHGNNNNNLTLSTGTTTTFIPSNEVIRIKPSHFENSFTPPVVNKSIGTASNEANKHNNANNTNNNSNNEEHHKPHPHSKQHHYNTNKNQNNKGNNNNNNNNNSVTNNVHQEKNNNTDLNSNSVWPSLPTPISLINNSNSNNGQANLSYAQRLAQNLQKPAVNPPAENGMEKKQNNLVSQTTSGNSTTKKQNKKQQKESQSQQNGIHHESDAAEIVTEKVNHNKTSNSPPTELADVTTSTSSVTNSPWSRSTGSASLIESLSSSPITASNSISNNVNNTSTVYMNGTHNITQSPGKVKNRKKT